MKSATNLFCFRSLILFSLFLLTQTGRAQRVVPQFEGINFSKVVITDAFWKPRMETVATSTVQACIFQTETKTHRIKNFEVVADRSKGKFEGIFYDDSDVYKALEAIAYSLNNYHNPVLEKKADEWIDKIAAAQQTDGYLNTYYTLQAPESRWSDMSMHEDYNGGHLIEAAVAYYNATGKRKLLDVAIRFADHFDHLFGPERRDWVTGHQELELALVKLFKTTKDARYLKLADWLLSERGRKLAKGYTWTEWKDTAYAQDAVPVKLQREITGHAVRAMYLYTGAADVAAQTGDADYMKAMQAVWEDVVYRNLYITGGIGSSGGNEGFSIDYDLPNENAYCETCASVGMVFWNQRMNLLTGDSKFVDVLERSLYNGALDGLSLTGDRFFYGNPLASTGRAQRKEWFGTACCPSNIARLVSSLGDYVYGSSDQGLWVNLFVGSTTKIKIGKIDVPVALQTEYPWNGKVRITLQPTSKVKFGLHLRIPSWVQGHPVPGDLYRFENATADTFTILVNGRPADYKMENGYAVITREWRKGDVVVMDLPMEVKRIVAREEVKADIDRVALQRGPLVYCVEGADNQGKAWNLILPDKAAFSATFHQELLNGVVTIQFDAPVVKISEDGLSAATDTQSITAIPYYAWANRGSNPMQVWIPRKIKDLRITN